MLEESPATPTNNHLLFLTGGSGITPAMSILQIGRASCRERV